jgi:hypothetical protein
VELKSKGVQAVHATTSVSTRPLRDRTRPNVDDFRSDTMFPRVERAVAAILAGGKVVAPVDVLVRMELLSAADLEAWRFGRVPYLERVIRCNLSKLSRLLWILGFHCHDLNLTASQTAYVRWGKGPHTALRFTKTREERLEKIYARHFVWPGKGPFHPPRAKGSVDAATENTCLGSVKSLA